jgi:hypothetical protein
LVETVISTRLAILRFSFNKNQMFGQALSPFCQFAQRHQS